MNLPLVFLQREAESFPLVPYGGVTPPPTQRFAGYPVIIGRTDKQHTKSLIWIVMLYAALL